MLGAHEWLNMAAEQYNAKAKLRWAVVVSLSELVSCEDVAEELSQEEDDTELEVSFRNAFSSLSMFAGAAAMRDRRAVSCVLNGSLLPRSSGLEAGGESELKESGDDTHKVTASDSRE